jgi:hypothetical protein
MITAVAVLVVSRQALDGERVWVKRGAPWWEVGDRARGTNIILAWMATPD